MFYIHPIRIIVSVVILLVIGCRKKVDAPAEARQSFDREGLKFIQLPPNKTFIYRDSASGVLDSVIVTESLLEQVDVAAYNGGPFNFANHPAYHYERFFLTLTLFAGANQSSWLKASTGDIVAYSLTTDRAPIRLQDASLGLVFEYTASTAMVPAMTIEGKTYNNIVTTSGITNGITYTYFWAKNIGLVRTRMNTGLVVQTKNLLR